MTHTYSVLKRQICIAIIRLLDDLMSRAIEFNNFQLRTAMVVRTNNDEWPEMDSQLCPGLNRTNNVRPFGIMI